MLLESMDFKMHGFFEQSENNTYGQVNATRLTAVAMQEGTGSRVEIRVNLPTCRWRNKLQVLVNDKDVLFNSTMNKWQWFKGASSHFSGDVSVFGRAEDMGMQNVTVMFPSGTGIQAVEANGVMNVYVSASPHFYKNTTGLFGFWDRWTENDLMLPDHKQYITSTSHENIYNAYGILWRFSDQQSDVLLHPIGRNFSYTHLTYNLRKFYPIFGTPPMPKNATLTEEEVRTFCTKGGYPPSPNSEKYRVKRNTSQSSYAYGPELNEECVYDYRVTANKDIAKNTLEQGDYWKHLYKGIKPTNSCGVLPVRGDWEGALRYPLNYMADADVTVTCRKGYNFYGQSRWHCNREAQWEGALWGRDEEWPMCLSIRHTAEYSGIVGAPVLGGVLIVFFVFLFIRSKKKEGHERKNPFAVPKDEEARAGEVDLRSPTQESIESLESVGADSSATNGARSSGARSSGAISTISGSLAAKSSSEGFNNKGLDTSAAGTPASSPDSTLKKKQSGSIEYMETEGL